MIIASLSAPDTWSDSFSISAGVFNFSIWGTFVATLTVQRSFDSGSTWLDVDTFTAPGEWIGEEGEGSLYRVGIKVTDYTSGTANIRLKQ